MHGIPRTVEEMEVLAKRIAEVVDEVGGKVCTINIHRCHSINVPYVRHQHCTTLQNHYLTPPTSCDYLHQASH